MKLNGSETSNPRGMCDAFKGKEWMFRSGVPVELAWKEARRYLLASSKGFGFALSGEVSYWLRTAARSQRTLSMSEVYGPIFMYL